MATPKPTLRKVCIAIAILGLAFGAAPAVAATCVPNNGPEPRDACAEIRPFDPDGRIICISNTPKEHCLP